MGRDLLAQDYMLKQITASLIYPQDNLGKKFWDRVYSQAQEQYGTSNIPVNTFNKVWILPDDALIYEKGNTAYVLKNHLKVMLEEDYMSLKKHAGIISAPRSVNALGSKIVRQIVLPELEREVNQDENFAALRQVYSGMLLAAWYKRALKESLLSKIYANHAKVKGVDQDPRSNEEIYQQYLKAYKKGAFNFIREDVDKYTNETIPRKYFSGGTAGYDRAMSILNRKVIQVTGSLPEINRVEINGEVRDWVDYVPMIFQLLGISVNSRRQGQKLPRKVKERTGDRAMVSFLDIHNLSDLKSKAHIYDNFDPNDHVNNHAKEKVSRLADFIGEPAVFNENFELFFDHLGQNGLKFVPWDVYHSEYRPSQWAIDIRTGKLKEVSQSDHGSLFLLVQESSTKAPINTDSSLLFYLPIRHELHTKQNLSELIDYIAKLSADDPGNFEKGFIRFKELLKYANLQFIPFSHHIINLTLEYSGYKQGIDVPHGTIIDEKVLDHANPKDLYLIVSVDEKGRFKTIESYRKIFYSPRLNLTPDSAMTILAAPGGIDLNSANLNLQIKRDGKGVALPIIEQDLENIHIDGLTPVILGIIPAKDTPLLSQLQVSNQP